MVKPTYPSIYIIHIYIRGKTVEITKDANIIVGNIPSNLFFVRFFFPCEKANIDCWLLLPNILESMNL